MTYILVTGSTGLIGSHLCKRLVKDGYSVIGLKHTRTNPITESLLARDNFKLEVVDVQDKERLEQLFRDYQVNTVIHTIAHMSYTPNHDFSKVNIQGTNNLLEASVTHGVENFINISSNAVYSKPPKYNPIDEEHPNTDLDAYGESKLYSEIACRLYASYMRVIILRCAGIYGQGMDENRAIPKFIQQAKNNEPLIIDGDGRQTRDFVHVDDVVAGIYLAWQHKARGTFNLGSGEGLSVLDLAYTVKRMTNSYSVIRSNGNTSESYDYVLDITKARDTFGYKPHLVFDRLNEFIRELKGEK